MFSNVIVNSILVAAITIIVCFIISTLLPRTPTTISSASFATIERSSSAYASSS